MAVMNFNTANQTYRQLVGNGLIYKVPHFQRDYSWTEEEWDDLWVDIQGVLSPSGEQSHYLGYLVLQSKDGKNFDIIDGQQRLTTLSIFALAIIANLNRLVEEEIDPENNKKRQEQLRNSFIGYLDPVTLLPKSKLSLNRNNDSFYQNYLVPLQKLPLRNLKATEHQMRRAFEWFNTQIFNQYGVQKDGAILAQVLDSLSDRLFFTVITVTDELNAYKVFETLNARGVKLSSTDLLKNYLFSVIHREIQDQRELNALDEKWEILVSKLGSESFPDFLRTYWNSKNRFVRHSELFKAIRNTIKSRGQVFELIRNLEADADTYVALSKPEDTLWDKQQQQYIREMRMFNVRQAYPLLLTAKRTLSSENFTKILKACAVISFRYNVIMNLPANEQERVYTSLAEQIANGKIMNMPDIFHGLRAVYPQDKAFEQAFSDKQLKTTQSRNKKIVRYILFELEKYLSTQDYDMDSELYSIEHILPENPEDGWDQFSDNDHEQFVYRLGNMILLNEKANRELKNKPFDIKRQAFEKSEFMIAKKVAAENKEWQTSRISQLQSWMANQAKTIWKISQLQN